MVPDLWFSPRIKIRWDLEAFQPMKSRNFGWVCCWERRKELGAFSAPTSQLLQEGISEKTVMPRQLPSLFTNISIKEWSPLALSYYLLPGPFSPRPEERDTERLEISFFHLIQTPRWPFFQSVNSCLSNQVLTSSNFYSFFLLD